MATTRWQRWRQLVESLHVVRQPHEFGLPQDRELVRVPFRRPGTTSSEPDEQPCPSRIGFAATLRSESRMKRSMSSWLIASWIALPVEPVVRWTCSMMSSTWAGPFSHQEGMDAVAGSAASVVDIPDRCVVGPFGETEGGSSQAGDARRRVGFVAGRRCGRRCRYCIPSAKRRPPGVRLRRRDRPWWRDADPESGCGKSCC